MELDGGLPADPGAVVQLHGTVAMLAIALLRAGAIPDPSEPPEIDLGISRLQYSKYPISFRGR